MGPSFGSSADERALRRQRHQMVVTHWLGKIANDPIFQCACPISLVGMAVTRIVGIVCPMWRDACQSSRPVKAAFGRRRSDRPS